MKFPSALASENRNLLVLLTISFLHRTAPRITTPDLSLISFQCCITTDLLAAARVRIRAIFDEIFQEVEIIGPGC
jgi:hypothetical protein